MSSHVMLTATPSSQQAGSACQAPLPGPPHLALLHIRLGRAGLIAQPQDAPPHIQVHWGCILIRQPQRILEGCNALSLKAPVSVVHPREAACDAFFGRQKMSLQ